MKKLITLVLVALIATTSYAQKDELKMAQKAVDANNYTEALTALSKIESTIDGAKIKYKTQYYFLAGNANYANGTTPDNFKKASKAFNKVIDLESKGAKKYTNEVSQTLNSMIQKVADSASKDYNKAIQLGNDESTKEKSLTLFNNAAKGFENVYAISSRDTSYVQFAANAYYFSENYENSIRTCQQLLDLGYTGISTSYTAKSLANGQMVKFNSQEDLDKQVLLKLVEEPKVVVKDSQKNTLIKLIANNYVALKDNEKALAAILEAKKATPDDYGLLVDEANIYYAMGDNVKFKEKLEEAIKINPTDPMLYYNIGVTKMDLGDNEGAILSFNKAIELKPDYAEAYNNIGAAILLKNKSIVDEMNNTTNFAKYDKLLAQQHDVYKEAMPFYEKAFGLDSSNLSTAQTLLGIYENLEMDDQYKNLKVVYDQLKN